MSAQKNLVDLHGGIFRTDRLPLIANEFDSACSKYRCRFCCNDSVTGNQNALHIARFAQDLLCVFRRNLSMMRGNKTVTNKGIQIHLIDCCSIGNKMKRRVNVRAIMSTH